MKTPKEKYLNDSEYRHLVDMMESLIEQARFTPSELREASILACINYEMSHVRDFRAEIDPRVSGALDVLDQFVCRHKGGKR